MVCFWLPSGKHTKNYGKSQFLMGKFTITIFTSYVSLPEGTNYYGLHWFTNCGLWWVPDDLNCRWSLHYSQKWWKPHQKLKRLSPRFGFEAWHSTDLDFRCATGALLQGQCNVAWFSKRLSPTSPRKGCNKHRNRRSWIWCESRILWVPYFVKIYTQIYIYIW